MSPSSATLTVSYTLHPPPSSSTPGNLHPSTTHEFPLQVNQRPQAGGKLETYYAALRDAIAQAKELTGRELTEWRDAVGDREKDKTGGKVVDEVEEDEEDGADEELELEVEKTEPQK